jgi:hypothetical protein
MEARSGSKMLEARSGSEMLEARSGSMHSLPRVPCASLEVLRNAPSGERISMMAKGRSGSKMLEARSALRCWKLGRALR